MPITWFVAIILALVGGGSLIASRYYRKKVDAHPESGRAQRGFDYSGPTPTPFKWGALAAFALAAVAFLSAFVYTVPARTVAIPTRFGKVLEQPLGGGIHIKDPFLKLTTWDLVFKTSTMTGVPGCDPKTTPDCQGGDHEGGDAVDVRGSDNGLLWVDTTVRYKVRPEAAITLYNDARSELAVREQIVRPRVRTIMRDVFAQVTSTDAIAKDRKEIGQQVTDLVRGALAGYGIDVDVVDIRGITPSSDVDASITQKLKATQAAEQALITQQQAQTEAATRANVAKVDADAARTAAQGQADAVKTKADAEAYANDKVAQSVTDALTRYIMAQQIGKAGNVIYLPENFGGLLQLTPPAAPKG